MFQRKQYRRACLREQRGDIDKLGLNANFIGSTD
jgi:hypothetical protein